MDLRINRVSLLPILSAISILMPPIDGSRAHAQDWNHDWVAVTVNIAEIWGSATHRSRSQAIALAIQDCRRRAGLKLVSCGALMSTTREAWSLSYKCDQTLFIVTGKTLATARRRAIARELSIYLAGESGADACRLVVGVDPSGRAMEREIRNAIVPLIPESSQQD